MEFVVPNSIVDLLARVNDWLDKTNVEQSGTNVFVMRRLNQGLHRSADYIRDQAKRQWAHLPAAARLPHLNTAFALEQARRPHAVYPQTVMAKLARGKFCVAQCVSESVATDSDDSD